MKNPCEQMALIIALENELTHAKRQHFYDQCADNYYASNGGWERGVERIRKTEEELKTVRDKFEMIGTER